MKQGKSLIELATELNRQKEAKRDFLATGTALRIETDNQSKRSRLFLGGETLMVNATAHDQMASRLEIPVKYYDKMRETSPELLDHNVNHWFSRQQEKYLVRSLDGNMRALLSNKYRPLDNAELAEVALPQLIAAGAEVESCEVTEKRLYIKAVTPRINFEVKKNDVVQAGIVISNSEIGMGSLSIEPLLYRLVCLNGLIINDAKIRKTHVGRGNAEFAGVTQFFRDETREMDDRAFWMKVRDTLQAVFSTIGFAEFAEQFKRAQDDVIEADVVKVVEVTQKRFGLTEGEKSGVLHHLIQGGDMNRFGLINAVTRTAQDVPDYDRSTELERLGGTILELPRRDWETIAIRPSDKYNSSTTFAPQQAVN